MIFGRVASRQLPPYLPYPAGDLQGILGVGLEMLRILSPALSGSCALLFLQAATAAAVPDLWSKQFAGDCHAPAPKTGLLQEATGSVTAAAKPLLGTAGIKQHGRISSAPCQTAKAS
ncbi:hypothetical protein WJX73_010344 [Symbiochloris irregularis]|uniref:Uncharacterized protein n=1 Tax=Symbiochloris irregularis TaxID=706552 RepID=A0AAW1PVW8_9CHLO